MRVTQSMLSNTMLRNLNTSYTKLAQLQEQISTGSKLLRPSDDPVGVAKAMSYRTQLTQNAQYDENLDTATKWLDSTDTALGSMTSAMQRVQELVTQAANDTNQSVDRAQMLKEIEQIYEEIKDLGNTKIGDTYIFSGARTNEPLYGENVKEEQVLYRDANGNIVADVKTSTQKDGTISTVVRDNEGNIASMITTGKDAMGNTITTITDGNNNVIPAPSKAKYLDSSGNIIETAQDGTLSVSHAKDASNVSSVEYFKKWTISTQTYGSPAIATEERIENEDGTSITSILDSNNKVVAKIEVAKDDMGFPITTVKDGEGNLVFDNVLSVEGNKVIKVDSNGLRKIGTLNEIPLPITTSTGLSPGLGVNSISRYVDDLGNTIATANFYDNGDGTSTTEIYDSNGKGIALILVNNDQFGDPVKTVYDENFFTAGILNPIEAPNIFTKTDGSGNVVDIDALGNMKVQYFKDATITSTTPEETKNLSVSEFTFKDASGNPIAISETVINEDDLTFTTTVHDQEGNLISTAKGPSPVVVTDGRNLVQTSGVNVEKNGAIITTDPITGLTTVTTKKDNISTSNEMTTISDGVLNTTTYKDSANNMIATIEKTTKKDGTSSILVKDKDGNEVSKTDISKDAAGRQVITVTDLQVVPNKIVISPDKVSKLDDNGNYIITNPITGLTSVSTTTPAIEGPKMSLNTSGSNRLQTLTGMSSSVNVEVYNDIQLEVNTTGAQTLFSKLDTVFEKVFKALDGTFKGEDITKLLGGINSVEDKNFTSIQGVQDLISMERSTVGAKQNRVDMMADRLALQKETLTKQQSNVEDVEYEEAITNMITQQSIHNAALSVGGKIIQQTLVDFIR